MSWSGSTAHCQQEEKRTLHGVGISTERDTKGVIGWLHEPKRLHEVSSLAARMQNEAVSQAREKRRNRAFMASQAGASAHAT